MISNRGKTLTCFGLDQTNTIDYGFNQQGFRHHMDYDFEPSVAFFGCSLVFGIGVPYQHICANKFADSHNYGLAGAYNDMDVLNILNKFIANYPVNIPKVVVWKNFQASITATHIKGLPGNNIYHFFCHHPIEAPGCYRMVKNLDHDVSGTHPGPITHNFFYKTLCPLLNR